MTGYSYRGTGHDTMPGSLLSERLPDVRTPCGHTKVGPTGIHWICTANQGPPPGQKRGRHSHYYVNRYPTLDRSTT